MALKGKASNGGGGDGGEYELLEADTYEGRLVAIVELGEHDTNFGRKQQVLFVWELSNAPFRKDKRPWIVYDRYTLSFAEKATLRKNLEAWRRKPYAEGEDIDPTKFLSQPWSIEVIHKEDGKKVMRHRIASVGPVPKNRQSEVKAPSVMPFCYEIGGSDAELKKAETWLPYVFGVKVADLVAEGKRNLNLKVQTDTGLPTGLPAGRSQQPAAGGDPGKEEEIPF